MSSRELTTLEKKYFAERFIEVCGSNEPAEISRLLKISYQAARNYLDGRLPDANILLSIAEKTPYSIHWLLTGVGEKFVDPTEIEEESMTLEKIREIVKESCVSAIQETLVDNSEVSSIKTVVISKNEVLSEKSRG